MFSDAGETGIFFNNALDRARAEAAKIASGFRDALVFTVVQKERRKVIVPNAKVIFDVVSGRLGDENRTVFAAFATYNKFATLEVDIPAIQAAKLGNAETARKEQFNDRAVAELVFGSFVAFVDGIDDALDLIKLKKVDLRAVSLWQLNQRRIERGNVAFSKIFQKTADGDKVVTLGRGGEMFTAVVFETVKLQAEFAETLRSDIARQHLVIQIFAHEVVKTVEIQLIISHRVQRATKLNLNILEVILN